ncbi:GntR family transcriptional regulator [Ruegeria atlantica]|uniref:GntR family transcriptional regulator n=1 Tax=Ruegeria atlantica TaxID=81569 RepID=UPI00147F1E2A|nr:GntR family transcriptional regulator [Ruegeria atlantica]
MKSVEVRSGRDGSESAADPIYADLKERILSGDLPGETPLRQDNIAVNYNVSKIPVREALRRLENEGLVTFRPRRGAIVRSLSNDEVLHLMDIRIALECRALELAVPNMIESDFTSIRKLLDDYAVRTEVSEWSELNQQFHQAIYEPCGNREILTLIASVQQKLGRYLRILVTEIRGLQRPMREHAEILTACEDGRIEDAVQLLRRHIETTKKEVAAHLLRGNKTSLGA